MKKIGLYVVQLIVVLVCAVPALAAWVPAGLQGKDVVSLVEDPTVATTWFAGTADGLVYRQIDSGGFTTANSGLPGGMSVLAISVDPTVPGNIYAGLNGGGIYKSINSGISWTASGLNNESVRSIEIDPYNSSIIYVATGSGIYKSLDAGNNWQALSDAGLDATDIKKITLNPADPNLVPAPGQTDILFAAAIGGIYKSTDGGGTWIKSASGDYSAVAIDPLQPTNIYAGTVTAGMYQSTDGGATWTQINNGLGNQKIQSIAIYPYSPTSILVGTVDAGMFRTDDMGSTWYAWNDGNAAVKINAVFFLKPQAATIFAATADGVVSFDNSKSDLVVTDVTFPANAKITEMVTATVTVKNVGTSTSFRNSLTGIYLSTDATITHGVDQLLANCWVNQLAAGASSTCTVQYTIPWNQTGTFYIGGIADNDNRETDETVETNNSKVGGPITIIRDTFPDLVVTDVTFPANAKITEMVTATVTVKNVGTSTSFRNSLTGIYLSTDATITHGVDQLLANCWVNQLAAGASSTCTVQYTIPWNQTGTFYIGGIADNDNRETDETVETNNSKVGGPITIIRDTFPDLVVTDVTFPANAKITEMVTATVTVKNVGTSTSFRNSLTGIYLSTDATITHGVDQLLANCWVNQLAAGASSTCTVQYTIPWNQTGTFYIGGIADNDNRETDETVETNNSKVGGPITIIRDTFPDLVVTDVTFPANAKITEMVTATVTVKNVGTSTSFRNSLTGIYLSTDATITHGVDQLLANCWVNQLAAGASSTCTVQYTIPWNQTGTFYIGGIADNDNRETDETVETNNSKVGGPITIIRDTFPDLVVTDVTFPANAKITEMVTATVTVKNVGTSTSFRNSLTGIYLSTDATITHGVDQLLANCWVNQLAAGASSTCTVQYTIPWNQTGTFYIGGIADNDNRETDETVETNNSKVGGPITIIRDTFPDLVVTDVTFPANAKITEMVTATVTVKNVGTSTSFRNSLTGIYLSTDATITHGVDQLLANCWVNQLAAGASSTCTVQYTIPWNQTGTFYIGGIADNDNRETDETVETNNSKVGGPITIIRDTFPDLVVTDVTFPANAKITEMVTATVTVKNVGTSTSFRNSLTGIYLSTDATITHGVDQLLANCWVNQLAAGASSTCTVQYTIPWNQTGTFYIGGIADNDNRETDETVETNNSKVGGPITIIRDTFPDLVVTDVTFPANAKITEMVTATVTVKNVGTSTSFRNSLTGIYLSTDATITHGVDQLLANCWVNQLAAGASSTCTVQYTIPWNQTGTFYIGGIADNDNRETDETVETNNSKVGGPITIIRDTFPDLVVTDVTFPANAEIGDVITVTATVKNVGTSTSFRNSLTGIYLSTDATITHGVDQLLANCWVNQLAAGASSTCTVQYTIPSVKTTAYYFGAIADNDNRETDETVETNNTKAVPITFPAPPVPVITVKPTSPTTATSGNFEFTAPSTKVTFECNRDGSAWAACTSPYTFSGLLDGSHSFNVRTKDAAGNASLSSASYSWTIDTVAPDTAITVKPVSPINKNTGTFEFTATETSGYLRMQSG